MISSTINFKRVILSAVFAGLVSQISFGAIIGKIRGKTVATNIDGALANLANSG
jgi:hypothetical protein